MSSELATAAAMLAWFLVVMIAAGISVVALATGRRPIAYAVACTLAAALAGFTLGGLST